ncbi:MAG: hypothetical protein RB294_08190 [Bacteroidales bacterium]|jgi:hypothetical protein|nr:hypothetical protein [Bacteroidales bacterium]
MKNKTNITLIIIATLILTGLTSCEKYPDNPMISLISRAERVANTWVVDNYKVDGSDVTSLVTGYSETFTKDGGYSYDWSALEGTGTWAFQNDDEEILLTGIDNQQTRTLFILKLEEKQFWYYYMDGSVKHEFHMIEN